MCKKYWFWRWYGAHVTAPSGLETSLSDAGLLDAGVRTFRTSLGSSISYWMSCFGGPKRKNGSVPAPDYRALAKLTNFSKTELQDIFSKYEDIADTPDGNLTKSAFISIPEVFCSPLATMVYDREILEKEKDVMNFTEFCIVLDLFSKNAAVEDKQRCKLH